jgi:hypothetical protein
MAIGLAALEFAQLRGPLIVESTKAVDAARTLKNKSP